MPGASRRSELARGASGNPCMGIDRMSPEATPMDSYRRLLLNLNYNEGMGENCPQTLNPKESVNVHFETLPCHVLRGQNLEMHIDGDMHAHTDTRKKCCGR